MKTCNECKFAIFEDYGYSNYTVEGTGFVCAKKSHPEGDFDRFYGENPQLNYAEDCKNFSVGDAIYIDVDGEAIVSLDGEQKEIWLMRHA